ncbi:DNA polymerase Y family protein [Defluviimonas sp. WL0024]|uniref:DNA-directed DNA polymerase n=1 Tax=Albidovulum salinarum TaxID=2984153 RepID=A0ABT2X2Z3_9RHOB|nr:DNA polymerase Y family protein [Defluviimonas sp. WL0024]MCU9848321.1 DNA polymerase Y family protein [Defluviimonas sp. WL0024]
MVQRRILSLWFPRLGAERLVRRMRGMPAPAFAVVGEEANRQVLTSLTAAAEAEGLYRGQPLRDALAMSPALVTRFRNPRAEAQFLTALRRWAGKFSPWVAEEPPEGLVIDLSGAAHLFGGEEGVLGAVAEDCAGLGLTVEAGIADTVGAAWALARHAGREAARVRNGDAIDQEARATRSRAAKRHWIRGGPAPVPEMPPVPQARISAPGQLRQSLAPLPLAALRIDDDTVHGLARLGLRHVGDIMGMPRAALSRRFGLGLIRRLDQALGVETEPVSPARAPLHFAVRLTLPDPIGLAEDIMAGIDRLLPALAARLRDKGRGARRVRLQLFRADQSMQEIELGLARPSADPDRLRPLLMLKLDEVDPGFGIDMLRLEAHVTEPVHARQVRGPNDPGDAPGRSAAETALDDLISKLGARVGMEAITRLAPADSHIPEKSAKILPAAWSEPAVDWPPPRTPRPLVIFRPEPLAAPEDPMPPARFRWRRRDLVTTAATGPERIAPEWWLDEPDWRSGTRDYWRVEVETGERLWLFFAHGGAVSGGWYCQGTFR